METLISVAQVRIAALHPPEPGGTHLKAHQEPVPPRLDLPGHCSLLCYRFRLLQITFSLMKITPFPGPGLAVFISMTKSVVGPFDFSDSI